MQIKSYLIFYNFLKQSNIYNQFIRTKAIRQEVRMHLVYDFLCYVIF